MRQKLSAALGLALCAAIASGARAEYFEFSGTAKIEFSNLGQASAQTSSTGVALVNPNHPGTTQLHSIELSRNFFTLTTVISITDPNVLAAGITSVRLTGLKVQPELQGGVFEPISGGGPLTANTMPATGLLRLCSFFSVTPCSIVAASGPIGASMSSVFNGPGVGGPPVTIGGTGTIQIAIQGEPWTIGAASVSNRTPSGGLSTFSRSGYMLGPSSNTSTAAQTGGVVQLVTANQTTAIGIPNNDISGQITSLRLEFVPEPELLIGLIGGACALALLGLRRER